MKTAKRFSPPTLEELTAYIREKGYTFSAEAFIAYYDSVGWRIGGKSPMKDWRSACVTWQKRETGTAKKVNAQMYEQRTDDITDAFAQFTQEEIEEMMRDEC